jgi:anti-sigma B factor antagonist
VAAITTLLNGPQDASLPGMTVHVDRTRGEATVSVSGRVTIDSSPQLRAVLLQLVQEQAGAVINIDLSNVPYMDSSGIATALEALRSAQDRFVKLRMVGVSGQVRLLVEATQLEEVFRVTGSEVVFG